MPTFDELRLGVSYAAVAPDPLVDGYEEQGQQQAANAKPAGPT